jgi:Domain of Unknown Function with PDB structure (DUF3857)
LFVAGPTYFPFCGAERVCYNPALFRKWRWGTDVKLERTAREPVHCVPVPDWVDHQSYRTSVPDTDVSCISNGLCRLLYDVQVDLSQGDPVWHVRTVQRVLTREGAERAAHVVADFDPGFQRLEVHFVRVVRGSERIEHAKPEAFQLLRRETNLERLPRHLPRKSIVWPQPMRPPISGPSNGCALCSGSCATLPSRWERAD